MARSWGGVLETGVEVADAAAAASWAGGCEEDAIGSFLRVVVGEGVSTNMMEGPAASSDATAVLGVGFEVNFGRDWSRIGGGWISRPREAEDNWDDELAALCDLYFFS